MVGGMFLTSAHRTENLSVDDQPQTLRSALVSAYPTYVASWARDHGVEMDPVIADAVVEGSEVLDGLLSTFERTDPVDQRRSPLELFREALRPVDRALRTVQVPIPESGGTVRMATWDDYGLSPGSSQVLGPAAHDAHLRWGIERVALMTRPPILLVGDATGRLQVAIENAGYRRGGPGDTIAVVDVDAADVAAIRELSESGSHVVAVGDSVNDLTTPGLLALGAAVVVEMGRFVADPAEHLPKLA